MNWKNKIITLIIISLINIPNLIPAISIQTVLYAESGNLQNTTIKKQAKYAAEKDAIQDTNRLVWFSSGLGCCVTTTTCAIVGCFIGGSINPPPIVEDSGDNLPLRHNTDRR